MHAVSVAAQRTPLSVPTSAAAPSSAGTSTRDPSTTSLASIASTRDPSTTSAASIVSLASTTSAASATLDVVVSLHPLSAARSPPSTIADLIAVCPIAARCRRSALAGNDPVR